MAGFELSNVEIGPAYDEDTDEQGAIVEVTLTAAGDLATMLRVVTALIPKVGQTVNIKGE